VRRRRAGDGEAAGRRRVGDGEAAGGRWGGAIGSQRRSAWGPGMVGVERFAAAHEHDDAEKRADVHEGGEGDDEGHDKVAEPLEVLEQPQDAQHARDAQHS